MVNTILAKRVNHIVAKGDHPVWPKGSKSHGFSIYLLNTAKLRDDSKKQKQNSAAGYFSTFRGILKEAYKKRMLKENINDFLDRIPEEETEINYLTEHELGLIINNECPIPVLRKAIIFACITGFRRSDILALKWEDIKELPKGGWCVFKRMQKTKNMANVPIGDDLMEVIGPRGEGFVFNPNRSLGFLGVVRQREILMTDLG